MAKIFTLKNKRHMWGWVALLCAFFMRLYSWTLRFRMEDEEGIMESLETSPVVVALWHNRIAMAAPVFPRKYRRFIGVLVSASRDGEYISSILRDFGITAFRGSSSRGGAKAMVAMGEAIRNGISPIITVDGPRGPRYTVHFGAPALAMKYGVKLVPVAFNYSRYWEFRSWDRMQLPCPFAKVTMKVGKAMEINAAENIEDAAGKVRQAISEITVDRKQDE
jgi:lysophospholipid acyltransferase (LPLAT)-like uncharacterized protein